MVHLRGVGNKKSGRKLGGRDLAMELMIIIWIWDTGSFVLLCEDCAVHIARVTVAVYTLYKTRAWERDVYEMKVLAP